MFCIIVSVDLNCSLTVHFQLSKQFSYKNFLLLPMPANYDFEFAYDVNVVFWVNVFILGNVIFIYFS